MLVVSEPEAVQAMGFEELLIVVCRMDLKAQMFEIEFFSRKGWTVVAIVGTAGRPEEDK